MYENLKDIIEDEWSLSVTSMLKFSKTLNMCKYLSWPPVAINYTSNLLFTGEKSRHNISDSCA